MDEEAADIAKTNVIGSRIAAVFLIILGLMFLLATACFGVFGIALLSSSALFALMLIACAIGCGFAATALFKAGNRNLRKR